MDLFPVEVQIRTSQMHREAEFGIAGECCWPQYLTAVPDFLAVTP